MRPALSACGGSHHGDNDSSNISPPSAGAPSRNMLFKAGDGKPYTTLAFGNGGRPTGSAASQANAEGHQRP
ncbi:MAG: hypothetical protein QM674_00430 [Burkholderiaceae bacterium]